MTPDHVLLRRYAQDRDEAAFTELVRRYVDFVYSTALRLVDYDVQAAQDVGQSVFTDLARKAWWLAERETVSGWLHTSARYAAFKARRTAARRFAREQEAFAMQDPSPAPEVDWEHLRPVLDEAVGQLRDTERDAVVLRFFQNKSHREVGVALGLHEDAARKRVDRALEKLRGHFARRGVTVSSALLATAISAHSVQAAPAGLASSFSGAAMAGTGTAGTFLTTLYMSTKTKIILAAAILLAAATATISQQRTIVRLRDELSVLRPTAVKPVVKTSSGSGRTTVVPATTGEKISLISKILNRPETDQVARSREMLDFIESLGADDIRAVLDNFLKVPMSTQADWAKSTLISRWAELDPQAALDWAKTQTSGNGRYVDLVMVFDAWAAKDPATAFAAIGQVNDSAARKQIMLNTFSRMAWVDPQVALDAARNFPTAQQASYNAIFYVWGHTDPSAASSAVLNLPPSALRNQAAGALAYSWAQRDPVAALAWADSLPPGSVRQSALNAVLIPTDPQFSAANIDHLPKGNERNGQIIGTADNWASQDPAAALAWVDGVATGQTHDQAVQKILGQMGQTDPPAAATYLAQETDPAIRNVAIPQLATTWAERDIQGALAWARSLPASDQTLRSNAFNNVMKAWTTNDPAAAGLYIQDNLLGDANFSTLAGQVASNWAAADPRAALAWAQTLPVGAGQDSAVRAAVSALSNVDPQSAWNYAQNLPAGNGRDTTLGTIIAGWSGQDPARAATLIDALPAGVVRDAVTAKVADNWIKQNPLAASQWVNTLPKGDARDTAVVLLVKGEWSNDLPTAFNWADSISKDSVRQVMLDGVVQEWAKRDSAAATAGVMAAKLTDEQRNDLLKAIQKGAAAK